MEEIIKKLLDLVEKDDITAYEISKKTGISQTGIISILNGKTKKPSKKSAEKIGKYISNYGNENINGDNNSVNSGNKNFLAEPHTEYKSKSYIEVVEQNRKLTEELINCKNEIIEILKNQKK